MNIFRHPALALKEAWSTIDHWIFSRWNSIGVRMGYGGEPSYTGKSINENTAYNSSVFFACTRVIADPLGFLPLHLYERVNDDERRRAREHPLYEILHLRPNKYTPAVNFRQTIQAHALSWGNGYAQIIRQTGGPRKVLSLRIIPPDRIAPIYEDGELHYRLTTKAGPTENLRFEDVLHIPGLGFDGVCGYSVVQLAKNSIGLDLAALEYGSRFFARGGRVPYILKHPNKFKTDQEYDEFRKKWDEAYGGAEGYGKAPILEGALEYQQIGFKPEDSQLLATRKFSVEEQCRWFLTYPFEVGDMSRANFSNIEQLTIDRVYHTLAIWMTVWEQQIALRLLTDEERKSYYAEFDRNAILMGDFETRMRGYATAKQNGFMNADTICAKENLPKLPGKSGASYHFQMNQQTVPGTGEPTALEKAALARASNTTTPKQPKEDATQ